MVFGALMVLTIITVGVSYVAPAVAVAVTVALDRRDHQGLAGRDVLHASAARAQGDLLGAHADVVFFVFLMFVPLLTNSDKIPGTTPGTIW